MKVFSPLLCLKKEEGFKCKPEHQKALDDIKEYLSKPPMLLPPKRNKSMQLYISASGSTIGSMLSQKYDHGVERAICYLSHLLNDVETMYSLIKKFFLSLYFSCMKLKYYIKSTYVFVYSHFDIIRHMLSKHILHSRIESGISS